MEEIVKEERIGDFMIRIGALTAAQVTEIIAKQKEEPGKIFGVIAIELGYLNDKVLADYIASRKKNK